MIDELLPRCAFPEPGTAVDCAVSGGADSLALLVLACAAGLSVTAVHVDHRLRPGSDAEAGLVAAAADRYRAGFRAVEVCIGEGPNLEARARRARYDALPAGVLTGHTADDQAETILLNLLRGSGLDGLAGIDPGGRTGRPLLALRRRETVALCRAVGLVALDDPSNRDPRHRRNRIRAEVLPLLDSIAERDVAALLSRQAAGLRAEAELLDELAATIDPTDARAVAAAPVALARRALRRWLTPALGGYPPPADAIERVLEVAAGTRRACELPGGTRVERHAQRLSLVVSETVR